MTIDLGMVDAEVLGAVGVARTARVVESSPAASW